MKCTKEFVDESSMDCAKALKHEPEVTDDVSVTDFIDNFLNNIGPDINKQEIIRRQFRSGYCYYFASMLKEAFVRGEMALTFPFSHIVWVDTDGKSYDIEGEYNLKEHDALMLIPVKYLCPEDIIGFRHNSHKKGNLGENYMLEVLHYYCKDVVSYVAPSNPETKAFADLVCKDFDNISADELKEKYIYIHYLEVMYNPEAN